MSFKTFESMFNWILEENPLHPEHLWKLQQLRNKDFEYNPDWFEVLYRTRAGYQCDHGHQWESAWGMILFRFHFDETKYFGRVRMKRFGQHCNQCKSIDKYYVGICSEADVWYTVQQLLLNILFKCYENRPDSDWALEQYIIPISTVPNDRFGGAEHQKNQCEACAYNRCQEMFKKLTKKKKK